MFKIVAPVFLVFLLGNSYLYAGDIDNDVKDFVKLLSREAPPSLSDYYRFYGDGAEEERKLEFNICKQKGWTPPSINSSCLDYIKNRYANKKEEKSFYFEWLKSKLSAEPKIEIIRTDHMRGKNIIEHDLIYAKLDSTDVVFFRTIGDEDTKIQFGILSISRINGVPVYELFNNDIKDKLKE